METFTELTFRFCGYVLFGLTLEVIFAMHNIDLMLGYKVERRVPFKYLEGFTSAYMIPLHGFGILFGYELVHDLIGGWFVGLRFLVWAGLFTTAEVLWGVLLQKTLGFYTWDYYAKSRFKVFEKGYTLWTLIPMWGIAGLILEVYSGLLRHLSPEVVTYFLSGP